MNSGGELMKKDWNIVASNFDNLQWSTNTGFIHHIISLAGINENDSVADWGCGTGSLLEKLKEHTSNLTGIDSSEEMIRLSSMKNPDVMHIKKDVFDFKNGEICVDVSIMRNVLHHIDDVVGAVRIV
ncbi:MAG: methyltransferase domain-containing protein, partial [bacterium]